ncbi:MAG: hypothetical protein K2G88_08950 [Oscillospiraceae bacterium]|nr:hypothetical protein [Oscillospiraceae bacterium]
MHGISAVQKKKQSPIFLTCPMMAVCLMVILNA